MVCDWMFHLHSMGNGIVLGSTSCELILVMLLRSLNRLVPTASFRSQFGAPLCSTYGGLSFSSTPMDSDTSGSGRRRRKKRHVAVENQAEADLRPETSYMPSDAPADSLTLDVAVIGLPNAGKSSLVNQLIKSQVSAVSPKMNTTRERVMGVLTKGRRQVVFSDTPGFVMPSDRHRYFKPLVTAAMDTLPDVDISLLVVDAAGKWSQAQDDAFYDLAQSSFRAGVFPLVVLNKVDLVEPKELLLPMAQKVGKMISEFEKIYPPAPGRAYPTAVLPPWAPSICFMVSAMDDDGVNDLRNVLLGLSRPGEWEFPSTVVTDLSPQERVEELIREQLYLLLHREMPYSVAQVNRLWKPRTDGTLMISQELVVSTESHRKVVSGILAVVGKTVSPQLCSLFNRQVKLGLTVRLDKKYRYE